MSLWACEGVAGFECTVYFKGLSTFRNLIYNDQSSGVAIMYHSLCQALEIQEWIRWDVGPHETYLWDGEADRKFCKELKAQFLLSSLL